ncbi:hypothetical protein [Soonwooa sp.]|uniref:hypothetical protein n=1 Tax=Soonwooa sp. TaxID=1938592 RepID=UPI0026220C32|nr:hypothetical protein [Soonwooa sp.]
MVKNFLKVSAFSLLMVFASTKVNAQSQHVEKLGAYITNEMSFLNMTQDQSQQVYKINLDAATAIENLDEKSFTQNTTQQENFKGLAEVLKTRNTALKEVLSPTQFEVFQTNKILRGATFRTMLMSRMLDLTDDQLQPVFAVNQKVVEEVRQDLDTYFSSDKNRNKKSAQRKLEKNLKKADKAFDTILSPQQIKIYHENADFLREVLREEFGTKH